MFWTPKPGKPFKQSGTWYPFFALLPKELEDGRMAWLEWIEYTYNIQPGTFDTMYKYRVKQ